eukprot:CAMPEP_0119385636 /NCGR_PEP_ID=MMETSP1334-20130426/92093_1 /TAXON_ID=127549 /ORGANISM="Calcidiscus leptoporus, Strain RCC1130" /LENGTH=103 /DNA_ID=CAMNT_0007406955 /DNA_START=409 /DNA_END=720 /DNA_ORIENTATION=-
MPALWVEACDDALHVPEVVADDHRRRLVRRVDRDGDEVGVRDGAVGLRRHQVGFRRARPHASLHLLGGESRLVRHDELGVALREQLLHSLVALRVAPPGRRAP